MNCKQKIFFRADADKQIGYGHFVRSLALADMIKEDFDCIFFTQSPTEYQKREIQKVCPLIELPSNDTKLVVFLNFLQGDEIVFLDNYFFTSDYQLQIKNREMHEMIHNALDSDVSINAFRNIQKDADNYYFESIREFLCESESCDPIDLVRNEGKMVVDRVGNLDDNNSKVITDISDLDVNVADWNMLISYIDKFI